MEVGKAGDLFSHGVGGGVIGSGSSLGAPLGGIERENGGEE